MSSQLNDFENEISGDQLEFNENDHNPVYRNNTNDNFEDVDDKDGIDDLPIFANAECKDLSRNIKETEERIDQVISQENDQENRLRTIDGHLKNLKQEVDHTNRLLEAKYKEIETENHIKQLVSRESARYQSECKEIEKTAEFEISRLNDIQTSVFQANDKMDRFKLEMNWNQEELEQWVVAAKQKEEDNLALQKYTRSDEVRVKDLNFRIEKLQQIVLEKRVSLESTLTNTQARQVELDRIAEEFKVVHVERQDMIKQWQVTIDTMKKRDKELEEESDKYSSIKTIVAERKEIQADLDGRLAVIREENAEMKQNAETLTRIASKKKEELVTARLRLTEFEDEIEALRNELTNTNAQISSKRIEMTKAAKILDEKRSSNEEEKSRIISLRSQATEESKSVTMHELDAQEAEQMLKYREQDIEKTIRELEKSKTQSFQKFQSIHALRDRSIIVDSDISGGRAIIVNQKTKLRQLDIDSSRQQELLYNAEFQVQQMERKVAKMKGERPEEEKRILNKEIDELETALSSSKDQRKNIAAQLRDVKAELKVNKKRMDDAQARTATDAESLNDLQLSINAIEREIQERVSQKEDSMLQNDILKLDSKRLRDQYNSQSNEMLTLDNRQEQLKLSMEERRQEIQSHKDMITSEFRSVEAEKHDLAVILADKKLQVGKIQAKLDALPPMPGLEGVSDASAGGIPSQALYIIQAAQKREELQRTGDILDQEIRKCEKNMRSLQLTLDHLCARNANFRDSFRNVEAESPDAMQLQELHNLAQNVKDSLFRKRKELQRTEADLEEEMRHLQRVRDTIKKHEADIYNNQAELMVLEEDNLKDNSQLSRLQDQANRSLYEIRSVLGQSAETAEPTIVEKIAMMDQKNIVLHQALFSLGQLCKQFPEMHDTVVQGLSSHNLTIPDRGPTRRDVGRSGGRQRNSSQPVQAQESVKTRNIQLSL